MQKNKPALFIILMLLLLFVIYMIVKPSAIVEKQLPFLGNHRLDTHYHGDNQHIDTLWHTVPQFNFVNQDGKSITNADVVGKIYVVDFFFTTCKTICPAMSQAMSEIYKQFLTEDKFLILSHTVDPETDNPAQLKEYASNFNAKSDKWQFLTGEKQQLYEIARKGYLLEASIGSGGPDDFIHTQNFALVDQNGRIRGIYDGLNQEEIDLLIKDVRVLLYKLKKSN